VVELFDVALLTITGFLLTITVGAGLRYYRLICDARMEYEKARDLVEEIVRSFNRELKRDTEKLEIVGYEIEGNSARIDAAAKRIDSIEKSVAPLDTRLAATVEDTQRIGSVLTETDSKFQTLKAEQETLGAKVASLQEQLEKRSTLPEAKVEPVIPIRRDKAMSALTETEISVLEMLAAEGAKTAPEIKERVQLSREHTARLMKKLYEEGYLERETDKIPFKYNIKKEMERFLKKPENPQS
jgi:chromosome segregation ATPase